MRVCACCRSAAARACEQHLPGRPPLLFALFRRNVSFLITEAPRPPLSSCLLRTCTIPPLPQHLPDPPPDPPTHTRGTAPTRQHLPISSNSPQQSWQCLPFTPFLLPFSPRSLESASCSAALQTFAIPFLATCVRAACLCKPLPEQEEHTPGEWVRQWVLQRPAQAELTASRAPRHAPAGSARCHRTRPPPRRCLRGAGGWGSRGSRQPRRSRRSAPQVRAARRCMQAAWALLSTRLLPARTLWVPQEHLLQVDVFRHGWVQCLGAGRWLSGEHLALSEHLRCTPSPAQSRNQPCPAPAWQHDAHVLHAVRAQRALRLPEVVHLRFKRSARGEVRRLDGAAAAARSPAPKACPSSTPPHLNRNM